MSRSLLYEINHTNRFNDNDILSSLKRKSYRDIDERDSDGRTPLMLLIQSERYDLVKALIDEGANINNRANDGHTVFTWACECVATMSILQHLVDAATKQGGKEAVIAMVNATDEYRANALEIVLRMGSYRWNVEDTAIDTYKRVKFLIDNGININHVRDCNVTPLLDACEHSDNIDVIKILVSPNQDIWGNSVAGANLKAIDECGDTALTIICRNRALNSNIDAIKYLIDTLIEQYGFDDAVKFINHKNMDDMTALAVAVDMTNYDDCSFDVITYLMDNDADTKLLNEELLGIYERLTE